MQQDARPAGSLSRSTSWWMASAVFMAAVIIALVVVLTMTSRRPSVAPAVPDAATSGTAVQTGDCPARAGSQEIPTLPIPGVAWESTSYGVMLPYSDTYGPAKVDDSSARCFSHDPAGAVMAASHIAVRGIQDPNTQRARRVIETQVMPGPTRDELIAGLMASPSTRGPWPWMGFRVLSYTDQEAVVMLAQGQAGSDQFVALTYPVSWQSGDWKVNLEGAQARVITDFELQSEFVTWGRG